MQESRLCKKVVYARKPEKNTKNMIKGIYKKPTIVFGAEALKLA